MLRLLEIYGIRMLYVVYAVIIIIALAAGSLVDRFVNRKGKSSK